MATARSPANVPTLTEVVQMTPAPEAPSAPVAESLPLEGASLEEARLTQQVLSDVQRQVDLMLEYRLREALAPALARVSDTLIRELRHELASTLRDIVARAVAQEIERHRSR